MIDESPRPFAALRTAGDEIPDTGAEIGAAEQRVGRHTEEQHHCGCVDHATGSRSGASAPRMPGSLGP